MKRRSDWACMASSPGFHHETGYREAEQEKVQYAVQGNDCGAAPTDARQAGRGMGRNHMYAELDEVDG